MGKPIVWHEWLCHSYFSFLNGVSSPQDLIDRAVELGYRSVTITDLDGVYGLARAYRAARGHSEFVLHYGVELHLAPDHDLPMMLRNTLVLIAQSATGYAHLCHLLTRAAMKGKSQAYLTVEELAQLPVGDIVAIAPMRGLLRRGLEGDWQDQIGRLHSIFGSSFYMAVTLALHPVEDAGLVETIELAQSRGIPLLLSQDVFFHDPGYKRVSDVVTAIRRNCDMEGGMPHMWPNSERSLHSLGVLESRYGRLSWFSEAIENSARLAASIHFDFSELRYRYPREMVPDGMDSMAYLTQEVWSHATAHYSGAIPEAVAATVRHELDLVSQLDFPDYFLTVFDIVTWARSQNILCQGRGSAANSAICFVLGITAIDPNRFDLLFERFISVERGDPPDIDVDFEHERREEVIQYIYQRYGRHRAAMVCNVICFKSRGSIRAVGKALGVPDDVISMAATVLNSRHFRRSVTKTVLAQVKTDFPDTLPDHIWELWAEFADVIRGMPRHLGIHSGGFVISQHPITALSPIEPATMEGRSVIQWSKDDIEALGFFKIDILALGGLTLIRKCFEMIQTHYHQVLTMADIPGDDPATYDMICKADTIGTFQIESRAQMSFLPRHQPRNFYDLVVQVAIIRPGPIQGGMIHPYLRRRRGEEAVTFPDARLKPILARTFGVPIFQEQVMRVAIAVGGFSAGEAYELRKNIGAFSINLAQSHWVGRLREGMVKNGIADEFIEGIMGHIHGFASYGFPESHAASFALLAYVTAYLKCHYPAPFFASILNSLPMGFYSPDVLVKTAQRCGVTVLPICIRRSTWDHRLEWVEDRWVIRLGFRLIRGIRQASMGAFQGDTTDIGGSESLIELIRRLRLSKMDLTALAAANAFHSLGIDRRSALWLAEAAPLLPLLDHSGPSPTLLPEDPITEVQQDYAATATSLGLHPAALMRSYAWMFAPPVRWLTFSNTIREGLVKDRSILVFGMITVRQSPPTAKGVVFITLWDETGSYDLIVKPAVYTRYRLLIDRQTFLCVRGELQTREGVYALIVTEVIAPMVKSSEVVPFPDQDPVFSEDIRNYM
jgi:error-prone DNA polymerase